MAALIFDYIKVDYNIFFLFELLVLLFFRRHRIGTWSENSPTSKIKLYINNQQGNIEAEGWTALAEALPSSPVSVTRLFIVSRDLTRGAFFANPFLTIYFHK